MTRIRITSGGSFMDSAIYTVADGGTEEILLGVTAVSWSLTRGDLATAVLVMDRVAVDVIGELPPVCGYRYEFRPHMACTLPAGHEELHVAHRLEAQE